MSYAHEDRALVSAVYLALRRNGLYPWMDSPPAPHELEGIRPGQNWEAEIRRRLSEAAVALAFFSSESCLKRGYVQREYRMALDAMNEIPEGRIWLIPVRLDDCDIPPMRVGQVDLGSLQRFDMFRHDIQILVAATREACVTGQHWDWASRLTPGSLPSVPGYEFAFASERTREGGGDYLEFFHTDATRVSGILAGIAGRGFAAFAHAVKIRDAARSCISSEAEPAVAMRSLNSRLYSMKLDRFSTAVVFCLDANAGRLKVAIAGHQPPILMCENMLTVIGSECAGPPLGTFPDLSFGQGEFSFPPGSMFVGYSDGVSEALSPNSVDEDMDALVLKHASEEASVFVETIRDRLPMLVDDFTLVCITRAQQ